MSGLMTVTTTIQATMGGVPIGHAAGEDMYPVEQGRMGELTFMPTFGLVTPLGQIDVQVVMRVEVSPPLIFDDAGDPE